MRMFTAPKTQITTLDIADIKQKLEQPTQVVLQLTTKFPSNPNNKQALSLLTKLNEKLSLCIQRTGLENIKPDEASPQPTVRNSSA